MGGVLYVVEDVLEVVAEVLIVVKVVLELLVLVELVVVVELVLLVVTGSFAVAQAPLEGLESPPELKARTT